MKYIQGTQLTNQNTSKNKPTQTQKKKLQHGQNRPTKIEPTKVPSREKMNVVFVLVQ